MVADVRIVGLQNLDRVARELKAAGDKELKRELLKGIQTGAKPLKTAVKRSADLSLPHSGGLAREISKGTISIRSRLGANPSVRLVATSKHDIKRMNAGTVRHPTYGHKPWVNQKVTPGWFDKPVQMHQDDVRKAVGDAIQRTINKIK